MNAGPLLAARIVAVASALATLALMGWAASWSWPGLTFMLAMMAWCVSVYFPLAAVAGKPRKSRAGALTLLATTILVAAFAGIVYVDAFFIHLDAQGALVFLFVPVVQWVAAVIGLIAATQLEFRARKIEPGS